MILVAEGRMLAILDLLHLLLKDHLGVEAPVLRGLLVEADVGQVHLANPEILHATEFGHIHAQVLAVIHEGRGARGACEHLVHEIAQLA